MGYAEGLSETYATGERLLPARTDAVDWNGPSNAAATYQVRPYGVNRVVLSHIRKSRMWIIAGSCLLKNNEHA